MGVLETEELTRALTSLDALDLEGLRQRWRNVFGKVAPAHLSKSLTLRLLAYRLQAQMLGDLSASTRKLLDELCTGTSEPDTPMHVPLPGAGRLPPGTALVREHDGVAHQVTVVEDGFAWNGNTYPSLSKVALAITGTKWSGPRFFGLRSKDKEPTT